MAFTLSFRVENILETRGDKAKLSLVLALRYLGQALLLTLWLPLGSCLLLLASRISRLTSRFSHLVSRFSHLISRFSKKINLFSQTNATYFY